VGKPLVGKEIVPVGTEGEVQVVVERLDGLRVRVESGRMRVVGVLLGAECAGVFWIGIILGVALVG
jgi:hypothetical protein